MSTFYYRFGVVETHTAWKRPSFETFYKWWNEFKTLEGVENYDFYVVGGALYDIEKTWDIDVAIIGDVKDVDNLGYLMEKGLDIALNKYFIYVDLNWYSSIKFAYENNDYSNRRWYLAGSICGPEIKEIDGKQTLYKRKVLPNDELPSRNLSDINKKHPVYFVPLIMPYKKHLEKPSDYNDNPPIKLKI